MEVNLEQLIPETGISHKLFHEDKFVSALLERASAKHFLLHVLGLVGEVVLEEVLLVVSVTDELGVLHGVEVDLQLVERMDVDAAHRPRAEVAERHARVRIEDIAVLLADPLVLLRLDVVVAADGGGEGRHVRIARVKRRLGFAVVLETERVPVGKDVRIAVVGVALPGGRVQDPDAAVDERADAVSDAMPEMAKAAQELSDFSERLTERADKVDAFEKAKDLAARQEALAKAAEEITSERPLDTAKLEAWKRLEDAAMRKAEELARQDPDSDIAEAKRKMESAAREMAQLKAEIEAAAAESNRLAKAADEQRKSFQGQQQRQAQEIAQAVADQQRALDALAQTNLAAAAQSQQAAKAHLQKADSLPAVKALQDLANEAAKLSAENKAQNRGEAESFPLQNKANDLAQSLQKAAAEAAKAEQALREALASPTNKVSRQALENLDRKLRAELPKQRAALDAAKAADAENGRNAQLGSAAEDQKRALEALEKGDVPAAEAAQRAADDPLAKGAATPSVKLMSP